jgi:hypothetical protein
MKVYRCAAVTPDRGQCVRPMYHVGACQYIEESQWTETMRELYQQMAHRGLLRVVEHEEVSE